VVDSFKSYLREFEGLRQTRGQPATISIPRTRRGNGDFSDCLSRSTTGTTRVSRRTGGRDHSRHFIPPSTPGGQALSDFLPRPERRSAQQYLVRRDTDSTWRQQLLLRRSTPTSAEDHVPSPVAPRAPAILLALPTSWHQTLPTADSWSTPHWTHFDPNVLNIFFRYLNRHEVTDAQRRRGGASKIGGVATTTRACNSTSGRLHHFGATRAFRGTSHPRLHPQ